jgi:hypothetical protein
VKTVRVQIEFSEGQMRLLDQLMRDSGVRTKKELVFNALTLLAWAVREKRASRIIASIDHTGRSFEVLLPALQNDAAEEPNAVPAAQGPLPNGARQPI